MTKEKRAVVLTLEPASSVARSELLLKALAYGKSGVGKTHLASKTKNVAVCLVESQGFSTIRDNHPHAIVPGRKDAKGTPSLRTMDEVREFVLLAKRGKFAEMGIKTLVFDSLTEIQQMMMQEILQGKSKNSDTFSKRDYGTLGTKMRAFLRLIRDLPYNVIVLCLADWYFDEESGRNMMSPLIRGGVQKELPGYFNLVVYAYKRQDEQSDDGVSHYCLADGDGRYITKPFGGLRGVLTPDVDLWLEVAADEDGEQLATLPGAPLPSTNTGGERAGKGARFGTDDDDDEDDE